MNRIQRYLEESREHPLYGDFVIVAGEFGRFAVTHETARHIRSVLDRWFTPTWIEFADRVGSIIRVRSTHIRSLVESTIEQRAHDRLLDRARDQEEGEGRRPWDNDCF